ncbi:MAG TPA: DHCW motif cupin fold protein [Cyclobacteriaceae bacterium]|nr:DHCW motif cupin fold protein [Cyclobacteriaceae bacterium]
MFPIPFHITDWEHIPATEHRGEKGVATWRTITYGNLRIRVVDYSPGYLADHWCNLGHINFCLEGSMTTELKNGQTYELKAGMSYEVSDDMSSHRTYTKDGARLFIVDGGFLKVDF